MTLIHRLMEPYQWHHRPSLLYSWFIYYVFHTLYAILHNLESVLKWFRIVQWSWLPLSFLRLPILAVIDTQPDLYPYERMIMIENTPIFIIGKSSHKILYIHGGGFISGDYMTFRSLCLEIYRRCYNKSRKIEIWFPVYPLYPEYSIDHAIYSLQRVHNHHSFKSIIADSAGGYLALHLISRLPLFLISPVGDLTCKSRRYDKDDINFNPSLVKSVFHSISHTPTYKKYSNVPRSIHILTSRYELFIDDTLKIYDAHSQCILHLYESQIHSLPLYWKYDLMAYSALDRLVTCILYYS